MAGAVSFRLDELAARVGGEVVGDGAVRIEGVAHEFSTINGVKEVLHTSCSCTSNPDTNLMVCNPICLDASSPDNTTGSKGPGSPLWTLMALKDPQRGIETCTVNR